MFPSNFIRPLLAICIAAMTAAGTARAIPTADGLYATVVTTEGTFTMDLEFEKAPMTVANFVGLAEGSRAWVDFNTGKASNEPFYDGLKIPRAVPRFVIQMGSPSNDQLGGPGYQFSDEFHPDLDHEQIGTVSMARSSLSGTNGSQFFITLALAANISALNEKHSVFGSVVEGLDVVQTIGAMGEDVDVTIQSVTITRIGAAAQAFDVTAWGLPIVKQTPVELVIPEPPASYELNYTPKAFTEFHILNSADFKNWSRSSRSFYDDLTFTPPAGSVNGRRIFRVVEAEHVPIAASLIATTMVITIASTNQTLTVNFTAGPRGALDFGDPLGTYLLQQPGVSDVSGPIGSYTWSRDLRRGRLRNLILEGVNNDGRFAFNLKFRADGTGSFTGYTGSGPANGPFPLYGTFTSAPTPLP